MDWLLSKLEILFLSLNEKSRDRETRTNVTARCPQCPRLLSFFLRHPQDMTCSQDFKTVLAPSLLPLPIPTPTFQARETKRPMKVRSTSLFKSFEKPHPVTSTYLLLTRTISHSQIQIQRSLRDTTSEKTRKSLENF